MGDDTAKRVLEFYSGIGGLRYALEDSAVNAVVVEAFDINDLANDVYEHNFGHRPSQGNIQGLSVKQLDKYNADAWLLSPPCQPYTRQGLQKDADDARASSFLKMLQLLPAMASPPTYVLVENVVGFENSVTHSLLRASLGDAGFVTQEFILSPLQFGIPYSRPRYFCLAKRTSENFVDPKYNGQLLCKPGPLLHFMETLSTSAAVENKKDYKKVLRSQATNEKATSLHQCGQDISTPVHLRRNEPVLDPSVQCRSVGEYLELSPALDRYVGNELARLPCGRSLIGLTGDKQMNLNQSPDPSSGNTSHGLDLGCSNPSQTTGLAQEDQWEPYKVPMNVVQRWIDASDIVTPESRRCCCFTKSYTRYAKGTGSFLATKISIKGGTDDTLEDCILSLRLEDQSLASLGLRYFTPREVASLHSFPKKFRFPVHIRLKQRYALLGNSLSVAVVSSLLKYLFSTSAQQDPSGAIGRKSL